MKQISWLVCIALLLAAASVAAQPPMPIRDGGEIEATVGTGHLLTANSIIQRAALSDDSVARIQIIGEREVLLTGLVPGETTLFIWQENGLRSRYLFRVTWNLDFLQGALAELNPEVSVRASSDGAVLVLEGQVANASEARLVEERANDLVGDNSRARVVSLLRHPDVANTPEDWLMSALQLIDPRIRVRRIQVGNDPDGSSDSFVLEGRVKTVPDVVRAVLLAERQLGGNGVRVSAPQEEIQDIGRGGLQNFNSGIQGLGGGSGNETFPRNGIAAQVARGLVLTSESGRVVSMLKVDEIPQIMVAIRAMEIDRDRANKVGINWAVSGDDFAIGSSTGPQGLGGGSGGSNALTTGIGNVLGGNLVGAFVSGSTNIAVAIDFLESNNIARSVSEPNILTLSGEKATVLVGGEVPIPQVTTNNVASTQSVFFQEFGIRMDIRPTLSDNNIITLEVVPSIVRPTVGLSVNEIPGFTIQAVQTIARVAEGQTLVLGGLLRFTEGLTENKVPGLGSIPILKSLFKWRKKTRSRSELVFTITPYLVPTATDPVVELPEHAWPETDGSWREPFEPDTIGPDGLPSTFRQKKQETFEDDYGDDFSDDFEDDWEQDEFEDDFSDDFEDDFDSEAEPNSAAAAPPGSGSAKSSLKRADLPPAARDDDVDLLRAANGGSAPSQGLMVSGDGEVASIDVDSWVPPDASLTESAESPGTIAESGQTEAAVPASQLSAATTAATSTANSASGRASVVSRVPGEATAVSDGGQSPSDSEILVVDPEIDPCLSFRTGPSPLAERSHCLVGGARLTLIEAVGEWSKVRSETGIVGWVGGEFLIPLSECPDGCLARVVEPAYEAEEVASVQSGTQTAAFTPDPEVTSWVVRSVVDPCLNLRTTPGEAGRVLQCLIPQTRVWRIGQQGAWSQVQTESGEVGWVRGSQVERVLGCAPNCSFTVVAQVEE